MKDPLIGATIDNSFVISAQIGYGGMGAVYKATQIGLDRPVALKLLHENAAHDKESNKRFLREGQNLAALSHPHIISFYQFGIWRDVQPYIAMEFFEGKDLSQILDIETRLPWQRAVAIALQVCDAMAYGHSQHIINRDLKPQNIMISSKNSEDFVKIIDFGLARLSEDTPNEVEKLTQDGSLIGTVIYMSPEQSVGETCTEQSDIYSLGCVIYETLTGRTPHEADTPIAMLHKHVHETPDRFSETIPESAFPLELEKCVFKALAKELPERYKSMKELANDLRLVLKNKGLEISAETRVFHLESKNAPVKSKQRKLLFVIPVLLLALISSILFAQSDPGFSAVQAAFFANSKDVQSIEHCLEEASRCQKSGKMQAAALFCESAIKSMNKLKLTPSILAELLSQTAEITFASGNKVAAGKLAMRSLEAILQILGGGALSKLQQDTIKRDSDILMKCETGILASNEQTLKLLIVMTEALPPSASEAKLALNLLRLRFHKNSFRHTGELRFDKLNYADALIQNGQIDKGLDLVKQVLNTKEPPNEVNVSLELRARKLLESTYFSNNKIEELQSFLKSQKSSKTQDTLLVMNCHRDLARLYFNKCDYSSAALNYISFFDLAVQLKLPEAIPPDSVTLYAFSMTKLNRCPASEGYLSVLIDKWNQRKYPHSDAYDALIMAKTDCLAAQKKDCTKFLQDTISSENSRPDPNIYLVIYCKNRLSETALINGNIAQASKEAQELISLAYKDGKIIKPYAWIVGTKLLANCYLYKNSRTKDAINLLKKASIDFRKEGYPAILESSILSINLSKIYLRQAQNSEAVKCLEDEFSYFKSSKTKSGYTFAFLFCSLANAYLKAGKAADAVVMLQSIISEPDDTSIFDYPIPKLVAHKILAKIYAEQGQNLKSEKELLEEKNYLSTHFNGPDLSRQAIEIFDSVFQKPSSKD